jgi:probable rRNA maturation factor
MPESIQFLGKSKFLNAKTRKALRQLLNQTANNEGYEIQNITYIFMSDDALLEINQIHLQHDDYTDIITFDLSDIEASVDGEIYVSIDRIKDNASKFNCTTEQELVRVLSHGLLHLLGYKDKLDTDIHKMREKEAECLLNYALISQ